MGHYQTPRGHRKYLHGRHTHVVLRLGQSDGTRSGSWVDGSGAYDGEKVSAYLGETPLDEDVGVSGSRPDCLLGVTRCAGWVWVRFPGLCQIDKIRFQRCKETTWCYIGKNHGIQNAGYSVLFLGHDNNSRIRPVAPCQPLSATDSLTPQSSLRRSPCPLPPHPLHLLHPCLPRHLFPSIHPR